MELAEWASWRNPNKHQKNREDHPVACVSWNDAQAYVDWLSEETGERYRLPMEAEWEYAARAGTPSARYWGEDPNEACRYANVYDRGSEAALKREYTITWKPHECEDGFKKTAPAGSLEPNPFGLYDMLGNVWEWVQDCWHDNYQGDGRPDDGSAWEAESGQCVLRVVRGGSWFSHPRWVRSATRGRLTPDLRYNDVGFRLALDL